MLLVISNQIGKKLKSDKKKFCLFARKKLPLKMISTFKNLRINICSLCKAANRV